MTRTEYEKKKRRCCITGDDTHLIRNIHSAQMWMERQIKAAIADGIVTFIIGCELGIGLWAGEYILKLKKDNPELHLIFVRMSSNDGEYWDELYKAKVHKILDEADLVVDLGKEDKPASIDERNVWMVEHSRRLIAIPSMGPALDIAIYAKKMGLQVFTKDREEFERRVFVPDLPIDPPEDVNSTSN